ncbi:hypothetical protein L7F22_055701 [Adiantum nelumboides]|nr:hypothetical protein [Adiantum nelumboides]
MLIGNPLMTTHVPLIKSKSGTFFITEGVPSPITLTCDRSIPHIPIISHLQAKRAIRKGTECALLYVPPTHSTSQIPSQISSIHGADTHPAQPDLEPRMQALMSRFQHIMLRDDLPPKLPPSRAEDHRIELIRGTEQPSQVPYRLSKALEGELETQIADLLQVDLFAIILTICSTHALRHEEGQVSPFVC